MKTIKNLIIAAFTLLSINVCSAQIKNKKTEIVKISGNCEMCKETIEDAGNQKKQADVVWDIETKLATIAFDRIKTNKDEILKRIALAGYDNELFLAPSNAYKSLHGCCQYERSNNMNNPSVTIDNSNIDSAKQEDTIRIIKSATNTLVPIFENYFALKDALIETDALQAGKKATSLVINLTKINTVNFTSAEKNKWLEVSNLINEDTKKIAASENIAAQREYFISLSENMYQLIKASHVSEAIYWQHCPMANNGKGANWLSKYNNIRNPYFGEMMLNCGKTVETIK